MDSGTGLRCIDNTAMTFLDLVQELFQSAWPFCRRREASRSSFLGSLLIVVTFGYSRELVFVCHVFTWLSENHGWLHSSPGFSCYYHVWLDFQRVFAYFWFVVFRVHCVMVGGPRCCSSAGVGKTSRACNDVVDVVLESPETDWKWPLLDIGADRVDIFSRVPEAVHLSSSAQCIPLAI
jgi:hypothetical protein